MTILGGIGFGAPWLLVALAALPILWLILRAVPPAPIRRRFPGVALLLGLTDAESVSDRTPWWLLLLRMLAVAAVIIGLSQPILNPKQTGTNTDGPLLIVLDASWAGATGHSQRMQTLEAELTRATQTGRPVAIMQVTDPDLPPFQPAGVWQNRLAGLDPHPWQPTQAQIATTVANITSAQAASALWFSDGLDYPGREAILDALEAQGPIEVFQSARTIYALMPPKYVDGAIELTAIRSATGQEQDVTLLAQGRDPAGNAATLSAVTTTFAADETTTTTALALPSELRARITRFEVQSSRSAGTTTLMDDSLRRREVALIAGRENREGLELLTPLHYLRQALEPTADLLSGSLSDVMPANPDVIVLADVATLSEGESDALQDWVLKGGLLLRFAGPRIAASDISRSAEDPLMPVRLRSGGRSVGGAMSWGEPKAIAPFGNTSPFFGLTIPDDVVVRSQVMAQPDPTLATRVIAELNDGTPLVTRKALEQGQIVLFHVTANAEWSTLPLSGLFVEMLERLAVSSANAQPDAGDLEGTTWVPQLVMDGFGTLMDAGTRPGVDGADLINAATGPDMPPGLYVSEDRALARNVTREDDVLTQAAWPARIPVTGLNQDPPRPLGGFLLSGALVLLLADIVASLALSGRLLGGSSSRNVAGAFLAAALFVPQGADAQSTSQSDQLRADVFASELVLAHIITGNPRVDEIAKAGMRGLSDTLFFRTSVEPANPASVDLETDDLAFFPILYWPITPDQPRPSAEAYGKLNNYLRAGGLILFDTRDADVARFGASSPNGRKLQDLAAPLDIPALEPVPQDHVITRTFYLLQDFPGRHASRDIWVESAPADAEQIDGMPFRNLNDGVTPVVIGGNDWAAAWAVSENGAPMVPIGRGFSGERQRELANRFGVNLVMHVLTGNYKSDQVHVPALLERLGN
ncbi:DUF4159 domain-containing protein [Ascidiaceihabitans sp.]|uniref:DUF4159 domain-containing protein n=1 Tax=Ascidiaceihabitans sp. TaxID=1872644 RepID=UPI0032972BFF